ncbi:HyaD/HybD family hydrogenase maturation endopeptidase [Roseospira navarrensis]|uniref:Hydrogenase expression/formation protein HupD n=1 Tax=Roseospira navarrensis TaxID=140058 RepID=A0A7X2D3I7_9PROT|nr:HyaD/HybD family hydrogenase maturation endopeptidase [Roseospira navarrensis]MQX37449.1 HyaD/HybD family hydrogenase maturation endopeptidase [Roseospira navarrensis]
MTDDQTNRTLVLGIGNLLWADEGFGVRCVEALHRHHILPEAVTLMDGGTQGLYLVQHVRAADALLVFDAVDYGLTPGEMIVVRGADVPRFTGAKKMSLHQTGFQDVLSAADLMGGAPARLTLIGVQAADLETWGGPLSEPVRARLDEAVRLAVAELAAWGLGAPIRPDPLPEGAAGLLAPGLDLAAFEGRPRAFPPA